MKRRQQVLRYDCNRTYDSRSDQPTIVGTRFDPTERPGEGGAGFGEVGRTADFEEDDVKKPSRISPVVTSTNILCASGDSKSGEAAAPVADYCPLIALIQ